jgi:hypothetical protein
MMLKLETKLHLEQTFLVASAQRLSGAAMASERRLKNAACRILRSGDRNGFYRQGGGNGT